MVKIKIKGSKAQQKSTTIENDIVRGIKRGLTRSGSLSSSILKLGIKNPPKTGRMYGEHRASRAGEFPANQTGRLMNSVGYKVSGVKHVEIGLTADYAERLESMNRPMLEKTSKTVEAQVKIYMEGSVTREVKSG